MFLIIFGILCIIFDIYWLANGGAKHLGTEAWLLTAMGIMVGISFIGTGAKQLNKNSITPEPKRNVQLPAISSVHAVRSCPWCAETILVAAKICKHCGKEVNPPTSDQAEKLRARLEALAQSRNNNQ